MSNPFYQGAVALIFTDENISAICYRISILCTGTGDTVTTTLMPTGEINTGILSRLIQYVQHWHVWWTNVKPWQKTEDTARSSVLIWYYIEWFIELFIAIWSKFIVFCETAAVMTVSWTLVVLLLTLHFQSHHTRNLLLKVDTDDKPGRVNSNSNKGLYGPQYNPG